MHTTGGNRGRLLTTLRVGMATHAHILGVARSIAVAAIATSLAVTLCWSLVGRLFRIESESMLPTLRPGRIVFALTCGYPWRMPRADRWLPVCHAARKGDVLIFASPAGDPIRAQLVKRVIGTPGDTIVSRAGEVVVNGVPRQDAQPPVNAGAEFPSWDQRFSWQRAHELRDSRFGRPPAMPTRDDWGPLLVPAGKLFVLGDNRRASEDSRYWGFVATGDVIGRVVGMR